MDAGARAVAAARGVIGVRFRLHGRDPAHGLDCVGVAAVALRAAGYAGTMPCGYALRRGEWARLADTLTGLRRVDDAAAGDVLLCRVGPGQVHLIVSTGMGFVHADAALRRVVERPGAAPWPVLAGWRVEE